MGHPDEYWQALEVAYSIVFGNEVNVALPWEWFSEYRLRNSLYPLYLAAPLYVLKQFRLDYNICVTCTPYLA